MLSHLSIRDFAVVRATELEFGPGLTVISGETGAGKSLLVDALGFLSGQRADAGMVRHGAARAELSARFELSDASAARAWLAEQDMLDEADGDPGEEACLLRRTLRADGGSRAWINGRPATLAQLAALAGQLVEIHGQHEHQALLSRPAQLDLLDDFGGHAGPLLAVRESARAWRALQDERDRLQARGDVSDRLALLAHQSQELAREALAPEAFAELVAAHRRQANVAALAEACGSAAAQLEGDGEQALARRLQQLRGGLARAAEHEPRLGEVDAMLDAAAIQLDEALALLERVRDDLDLDPARFEELDARLARLHELGRKHRIAPEALAAHRDALDAELQSLRAAGDRLATLDGEIEAARARWREAAAALSAARAQAAAALSERTSALIGELGMGGGRFEAALEAARDDHPDPQGAERVEFLVSANPGQPPRPLRKVASGGELSRISLAIEVAALGHDLVPTMVFDEVDSGIGGAVAQIVGQKLRQLGERRQALCVTHLPQVAAQGHAHYRVSKAPAEAAPPGGMPHGDMPQDGLTQDGLTQSAVEVLDEAGRTEELARMLGGVEVGAEVRAAARKLLAGAA